MNRFRRTTGGSGRRPVGRSTHPLPLGRAVPPPFTIACLIALLTSSIARSASSSSGAHTVDNTMGRMTSPRSAAARWPCLAGTGASEASAPAAQPVPVAVLAGGPHAVILSNQSDQDLCAWVSFGRRLQRLSFTVILYDYVGDPVDNLTAVARYAIARGAGWLSLLGASEGAKTSIIAATQLPAFSGAVVSLSAESNLQGVSVAEAATKLRSALLLITAAQDLYGAAEAGHAILRAAGSAVKRLITVGGTAHGTALLADSSIAAASVGFIKRYG